jgi:hypothetical protein
MTQAAARTFPHVFAGFRSYIKISTHSFNSNLLGLVYRRLRAAYLRDQR